MADRILTKDTLTDQSYNPEESEDGRQLSHDELINLDYASSGHTGFVSEELLLTVSGVLQDNISTSNMWETDDSVTQLKTYQDIRVGGYKIYFD